MKINKLLYFIIGLSLFYTACDPIEETYDLGGVLSAEEVATGITVNNEKTGNNKIIMNNNLNGVAGIWDFGVGTSTKKNAVAIVPPGTYVIKFTALCSGGIVTTTKTVEVTTVEYDLDIEWTNLCGAPADGGKTWVWANGNPNMGYGGTSTFFGNGSEFCTSPEWWKGDSAAIGVAGLYDEMLFTYTGVTFIDKSDASTPVSSKSGKFILDNKSKDASGKPIVGYLELPFYVMDKELDTPSKFPNPMKYEIVKLTANEMTLRIRGGGGGQGWGIICLLKRKGYNY
jgi:hypothetical protein